jgi:hypothetical protein
MKTAELPGTATMPADQAVKPEPQTSKMVLKKTGKAVEPDTNKATPGMQPKSLPQAKVMKPHVDVSAFTPPRIIQDKQAQLTALGGRYPLDDYAQVKTACAYFDEWGDSFSPEDRHTYAVNVLKRADALGIEASAALRKHGSEGYAPFDEVKVALDVRKLFVLEESHKEVLDKIATVYGTIQPLMFAKLLEEFDKEASINHHYSPEDGDMPDPYFSTFGFTKKAEFSETIGNMTVSEMDLEYLATKRLSLVKGFFTETFAEKFRQDPVGTYKAMPLAQRKMLANMARDQRAGAPGSG